MKHFIKSFLIGLLLVFVLQTGAGAAYVRDMLDLLPSMISNTIPGPTVVSDSAAQSIAYVPSNKIAAGDWGGAGNPSWWMVDLGTYEVRAVNKYRITGRTGTANDLGYCPSAWTLKGSNDVTGVSWDLLDTQTGISWTSNETKSFVILNTTPYRYYKFDFTATQIAGRNAYLRQIEFFDTNDLAATDLTPAMAANDNPSPNVVSASTEQVTKEAYKGFNHSTGWWETAYLPTLPVWIKFDFGAGNAKCVNSYNITCGDPDFRYYSFGAWKFQGSNDDSVWIDLDSRSWIATRIGYEIVHFAFVNQTAYRYYRFLVASMNNPGNGELGLGEAEFYEGYGAATKSLNSIFFGR
jgi:hypothetical protein